MQTLQKHNISPKTKTKREQNGYQKYSLVIFFILSSTHSIPTEYFPKSSESKINFNDDGSKGSEIHFSNEEFIFQRTKNQLCDVKDSSELDNYYYDPITKKCYLSGEKGPCGDKMIFGPITHYSLDNVQGECHCEKSTKTDRTLVYNQLTNHCFPIFTQGPCASYQWITLHVQSGRYQCASNPCLNGQFHYHDHNHAQSNLEFVLFNNRCVLLGSTVPECQSNQIVEFIPDYILPICLSPSDDIEIENYATGVLTTKTKCRPGTSRSVGGKCIKNFLW